MRLLEHYQTRLQNSTDGYEELDYIKQILASSLFQQYLSNGGTTPGLSQVENEQIAQASMDVINGMETTDDGNMSPTERRKRQIHRKQSLKALRNAVTPRNSPVIAVRKPHGGGGGGGGVGGGVAQRSGLSSSSSGGSGIGSGAPRLGSGGESRSSVSSLVENQTRPPPLVSSSNSHLNGTNSGSKLDQIPPSSSSNSATALNSSPLRETHPSRDPPPLRDPPMYPSERVSFLGSGTVTAASTYEHQQQQRGGTGSNLLDARAKNLSSSSSLLLEKFPPHTVSDGLKKREKEAGGGVFSSGNMGGGVRQLPSSISGSQPNISSMLKIAQQQNSLDFDDLMREDPVLGTNGLDWGGQPHHGSGGGGRIPIPVGGAGGGGGGGMPLSPPTSRPPPPSYNSHITQKQLPSSLMDDLIVVRPRGPTLPPPAAALPLLPYGSEPSMLSGSRTKSYEKLVREKEDFIPSSQPNLNLAPLAPPLAAPMTDGLTTRDLPTMEKRRTSLTIKLNKSKEGLGFRLKGLKRGGVFVQDLQVGGAAER